MRISVLGGCGFIGSSIVDRFLEMGHEVSVFDRPNTETKNLLAVARDVRFVWGDFLNQEEVEAAIEGADVVFHLISTTLPSSAMKNPEYDVETNVVGSIRLFDLCVKHQIKKVVFLSSGGTVYGIPKELPIKESSPEYPITPYGLSKLTIEKLLYLYHHHHGLDYSIIRLSNPYGVRQNPLTGQGVVASWAYRIKNGLPIEIWGDGNVVRDYIYIDDAIDAITKVSLSEITGKIVNVGSGIGHSLNQLHRIFESCRHEAVPVTYLPGRKIDVPVNVLDVGLLRSAYGWEAKVDINDGISRMFR